MKTLFQTFLARPLMAPGRVRVWALAWCLTGAPVAFGQTAVHLQTQARSVDFSGASTTKPAQAGTVLPATCEVGEVYFKTNATAGQNLYGCIATDSWSLLGDGGSGGGAVASEVTSTATGDIAATNVQSAIGELDSEKQPADPDLAVFATLACGDGQIAKRISGSWTCSADQTGGTGSLPATGGNEHRVLSNDGVDPDWRIVGGGLLMDSMRLAVDSAVVPLLGEANTYRGENTFTGPMNASGPGAAVDFSGALATRPVQTGTTTPASCFAGEELFIDTSTSNLLICNATGNGWVVVTGGGAGGSVATSLSVVVGDGVNQLLPGLAGYLEIPFACTLERWTVLADQAGSAVIDVWKDTYANYPPTDADSITASAPISVSSAQKGQDATLTGWNTAIGADDILAFNVDSATLVTQVTVALKCVR